MPEHDEQLAREEAARITEREGRRGGPEDAARSAMAGLRRAEDAHRRSASLHEQAAERLATEGREDEAAEERQRGDADRVEAEINRRRGREGG
jgi:hypothetical protein